MSDQLLGNAAVNIPVIVGKVLDHVVQCWASEAQGEDEDGAERHVERRLSLARRIGTGLMVATRVAK
jgi:hypothetical protein